MSYDIEKYRIEKHDCHKVIAVIITGYDQIQTRVRIDFFCPGVCGFFFGLVIDQIAVTKTTHKRGSSSPSTNKTKHGNIIYLYMPSNSKPVDYSKWDKLELSDDR